jgi:hypothetical protein
MGWLFDETDKMPDDITTTWLSAVPGRAVLDGLASESRSWVVMVDPGVDVRPQMAVYWRAYFLH